MCTVTMSNARAYARSRHPSSCEESWIAGSSPAMTEQANAPPARVFVRRRVHLFSYPSTRGSGAPTGASTIPRLRGAGVSCETRSPLGAPPRRFLPSGLLRPTPGPTFRPDPAGFRLRSSGSVCHAAGPRSRAGQQPRGSRRWLAKPSAGAAPAPPIKTPHDGALGMSRQQQDTGVLCENRRHAGDIPRSMQELVPIRKNLCVAWDNSARAG